MAEDAAPASPGRPLPHRRAALLVAGAALLALVLAAVGVLVLRSTAGSPEAAQAETLARATCDELWVVRLNDQGLAAPERLALFTVAVEAYGRFDEEASRAAALDPRWTSMSEAISGLRAGLVEQRALLADASEVGDEAALAAVSRRNRPFLETLLGVCAPLRA